MNNLQYFEIGNHEIEVRVEKKLVCIIKPDGSIEFAQKDLLINIKKLCSKQIMVTSSQRNREPVVHNSK